MRDIAQHFLKHVITHKGFFSKTGVKDMNVLYPPFREKLERGIKKFNEKYPDMKIIPVETYRSNTLQMIHYNNGASKIKKDGMHHYGISVDLAGEYKGKFTYNLDYKHLRQCMVDVGLYIIGTVNKTWDWGHFQEISTSAQTALRTICYDAVRDFQKKHGLKVDGDPGTNTIAKAKEVFANEITQAQAVDGKNHNRGKAKP